MLIMLINQEAAWSSVQIDDNKLNLYTCEVVWQLKLKIPRPVLHYLHNEIILKVVYLKYAWGVDNLIIKTSDGRGQDNCKVKIPKNV